jgi:hypothetical protein
MVKRTKLRSFAHVYLLCGGNLHQGMSVHEKAKTIPRTPSHNHSIRIHLPLCFLLFLFPSCLAATVRCYTVLFPPQNRRPRSEYRSCLFFRP